MIVLRILFGIVGLFIYLFLFWRRLKDDALPGAIFTTSLYVLIGGILATIGSYYLSIQWVFWFALVGSSIGVLVGKMRYKIPTIELTEAAGLGLMVIFTFVNLDQVLVGKYVNLLWVFTGFALIILFYFLDAHYKKFTWYKSGRIGFAGFFVFGIFFLIRGLVAVLREAMVSFVSPYDIYLSFTFALISFSVIAYLSRKK